MNETHPDMRLVNDTIDRIVQAHPGRFESIAQSMIFGGSSNFDSFYNSYKSLEKFKAKFERMEHSFRRRTNEKEEIFAEFEPLSKDDQKELSYATSVLDVDTKGLLKEFSKKQDVRKGSDSNTLLFMKPVSFGKRNQYRTNFFFAVHDYISEKYFPEHYKKGKRLVRSKVSPFQTIQKQIGERLNYYDSFELSQESGIKPYKLIVEATDIYRADSNDSSTDLQEEKLKLILFNHEFKFKPRPKLAGPIKTSADNLGRVDLQSLQYSTPLSEQSSRYLI